MSLNRHRNVIRAEIRPMLRAVAVTLVLSSAAALLPDSAAVADELTQSEIRDALVGRRIVWWQQDGWQSGHLTLGPNGAAELSVDRPGRQLDVGRWSLRGGELCTAWETIRGGAEKCYSLERDAEGRFVTSGGNVFEIREAGV
jgi:hypothetical protein